MILCWRGLSRCRWWSDGLGMWGRLPRAGRGELGAGVFVGAGRLWPRARFLAPPRQTGVALAPLEPLTGSRPSLPGGRSRGPGRGWGSHVQAVVVVELEFLFGGEVAAYAEVGGVLDQGAFEGDAETPVGQFAGLQGDEGVPAEQAGAYGRPLRYAGRVVEVDLVDRADFGAVAVERLAAYQVARIDVGLHGPSSCSQLIRKHYERAL